ncbi:MAG: hypothetical protein U0R64_09785 [Candidatus Nanopelagicales bacterium]
MRRFLPVAACAVLLVSGCAADPVKDASSDVSFTACSAIDCAGTLPGGATFDVIMPEHWNGSLAIFSHRINGVGAPAGKVAIPAPTPTPTPSPVPTKSAHRGAEKKKGKDGSASPSPTPSVSVSEIQPVPGGPEVAPMWGDGDRSLADVMLQAGYAIAGANPEQQGWVVSEQITAAEQLYDYFTATVGKPNRVYAWGESTGGLASARLAQLHPEWVSGALAICAPLSGPVPSFNLALDVAYTVRELLAPDLKLVDYASADEARRAREIALRAVSAAASGPPEKQAAVAFAAAVGQLPNASRTQAGATWDSQITANVEAVTNLLTQSTVQRYEMEQKVGGNFSGNAGTDYALRIDEDTRAQLDEIKAGLTDRFLVELGAGSRVTPTADAPARADQQGALTGDLQVPTLSLHNALDPVYIAANVSHYATTLSATGAEERADLVGVYAMPPESVGSSQPAAEGVGNCNFEPRTLLGAVILLDQWVRNGVYPGRDSLLDSFKQQPVSLDYDPGPWPQMEATAPASAPPSASADAQGPPRHHAKGTHRESRQ